MVARKFITLDQRRNTFVRIIDSIDDLQLSVQTLLDNLDKDISLLRTELPDFDDRFYLTSKLRTDLEKAKERDEFERIRSEIRRLSGSLNGFVGKRFESLRQSLTREHEEIYNSVRQGIPLWLSNSYPSSPLSDLLERQKNSLVSAYQGTLDEMRQERETSFKKMQDTTSQTPKGLAQIYSLFRDLSEKSRRLKTRLQSYQDKREEFEAWWQIAKLSSDVDSKAKNILQVYEFSEFSEAAEKLWKDIKNDFNNDPLSFGSRYLKTKQQIETLDRRISAWVDNQRSDFESKKALYQTALRNLGVSADVRVPFDPEHPAESTNVLHDQVCTLIQQHIRSTQSRLNHILEVSNFAIKVQKLDLQEQQTQAQSLVDKVFQLGAQFSADKVSDPDQFSTYVIAPMQKILHEEKGLYQAVRKSLKPGQPKGPEVVLYETLKSSNGQMDLRSLITSLLEKGEEDIDLEKLIQDIKVLFQKNLVDIHLSIIDARNE